MAGGAEAIPAVEQATLFSERDCDISRHPRIFRTVAWTGTCLCVLILAAWGLSLYSSPFWGGYRWVRLQYGNVGFGWVFWSRAEYDDRAVNFERMYSRKLIGATWVPSGGYGLNLPFAIGSGDSQGPYAWEVYVPLWIPFFIIVIPTVFAFPRARRSLPGHCQVCGYDLTGNVSGICPECGGKISVKAPSASPE